MAYSQTIDGRRRAVSVGTVAAIHALIGAGFVIGLAPDFITEATGGRITTRWVLPPDVPPPAPKPAEQPNDVVTILPLSAPIPKVELPSTSRSNALPTPTVPTLPNESVWGAPDFKPAPLPPAPLPPVPQPAPLPKVATVPATPPRLAAIGFGNEAYPDAARRAGDQGVTRVALTIGASGRATACEVTGSSGSYALDEAACRLVQKNSRFAAARDTAGKAVERRMTLPITWRLPNGRPRQPTSGVQSKAQLARTRGRLPSSAISSASVPVTSAKT